MTDLMQMVERVKNNQDTIDVLLTSGKLLVKTEGTSLPENKWYIEGIYSDNECNIGFGNFPGSPHTQESGSIPHVHEGNKEYLIVVRGSIALFVNGIFARTLSVGDVGTINPGEVHYSRPLIKDTKLVFVCVPADQNYLKVLQ